MWSYYGAKTNIIDLYPAPQHDTVIEPFCGTARYALKYFDRNVIIMDKYDVIIRIWKWLQLCSPKDVLSLPSFKMGENINSVTYDCEEARMLMGFLVGFGFPTPRHTATPRLRNRPNATNYTKKRIAEQLWKIKHWDIRLGSYQQIRNRTATWFIDPPYQFGGYKYKHSSLRMDFKHLAKWSRGRKGQVIVCENTRADWMDFKPMVVQNVLSGTHHEAIWSNLPTPYDYQQQKLILT